jgi:hypothetical protein
VEKQDPESNHARNEIRAQFAAFLARFADAAKSPEALYRMQQGVAAMNMGIINTAQFVRLLLDNCNLIPFDYQANWSKIISFQAELHKFTSIVLVEKE